MRQSRRHWPGYVGDVITPGFIDVLRAPRTHLWRHDTVTPVLCSVTRPASCLLCACVQLQEPEQPTVNPGNDSRDGGPFDRWGSPQVRPGLAAVRAVSSGGSCHRWSTDSMEPRVLLGLWLTGEAPRPDGFQMSQQLLTMYFTLYSLHIEYSNT